MAHADAITSVASVVVSAAAAAPGVRGARLPPCRMRAGGDQATAWVTSLNHAHPPAACAGDWPHTVPSGHQCAYPLFEAELAACARQAGAGPKKKIVLVLDRAVWHTSLRLRVPDHVYLHFLPPYSP